MPQPGHEHAIPTHQETNNRDEMRKEQKKLLQVTRNPRFIRLQKRHWQVGAGVFLISGMMVMGWLFQDILQGDPSPTPPVQKNSTNRPTQNRSANQAVPPPGNRATHNQPPGQAANGPTHPPASQAANGPTQPSASQAASGPTRPPASQAANGPTHPPANFSTPQQPPSHQAKSSPAPGPVAAATNQEARQPASNSKVRRTDAPAARKTAQSPAAPSTASAPASASAVEQTPGRISTLQHPTPTSASAGLVDSQGTSSGFPQQKTPALPRAGPGRGEPADPQSEKKGKSTATSQTSHAEIVTERLRAARLAFQIGNLSLAQEQYRSILKKDPRNHAALAGLASVAIRRSDPDQAKDLYRRILKENPRDTLAISGLLSLVGSADTTQAESQIKLLLRDAPDAVHLHFALGNIHVEQKNWPGAQSAFFNAYRLEPDNPDIIFNLAVALDRLGQKRAALEYYRKSAAAMHKQGSGGFDPASVQRRIAVLEQGEGNS
ncbi:MAG: tetratricopeptide repeat protein [Magnetococcales bacterium]|nr:tetratricopeptide repeat protein [Magnetococcales bacterium]